MKKKAQEKKSEEDKERLQFNGEKMDLPLLEWQQQVAAWADAPTHDREIVWVYDEVGGCGKDYMTKWLVWHKGAGFVRYGSTKHCLNVVASNPKDLWVVNLTRTKPQDYDSSEVYATIESIKDGFFFVPHYEGKMVMQKIPKVIVFANFKADPTALSKDRWNFVQLTEKDKAKLPQPQPMFQFQLGRQVQHAAPAPSSSDDPMVTQLIQQHISQVMVDEGRIEVAGDRYCYCGKDKNHDGECYDLVDLDEYCDTCGAWMQPGYGCTCHLDYDGGGCNSCGKLACSGDDCAEQNI